MPQIVAATYELMEKIGSGGGGVVYLGRHMRLDKPVVLKADKRTLAAKPEVLRREVDALKNLNHTYIPQVYDFISENNTVYTVMDYIEGESLDKPLKRGEHFSQPQVIEWACQILEALCYLHSRPPHGILHSDIKPANIMLTPQNDIRLIDFNIALALGETGAVRVGFSQGYASPEHYGAAFPAPVSSSKFAETEKDRTRTAQHHAETEQTKPASHSELTETAQAHAETEEAGPVSLSDFTETEGTRSETVSEMLTYERTEMQGRQLGQGPDSGPAGLPAVLRSSASGSSGSASHGVLLDVRSDIYSLGATLYHLLTGRRPAKDAREVEPITNADGISPAVAAIIRKAMASDPALRYQTAAEMLYAFEHLHENDPRTKRHRWRAAATAAVLAFVFLASGAMTFAGLRQMQQAEAAARLREEEARLAAEAAEAEERAAKEAEEAARSALAALGESENALRSGDAPGAAAFALEALALDTPYAAQAQRTLTDALGVYDLTDGFKSHLLLALPSEPLKVVLSPAGTRAAAMTGGQVTVFDTEHGTQLAALAADSSALADAVFAGEDVLLYAGNGALRAYDLAEEKELWSGGAATSIALSADGSVAAAAYKDENAATVYDTATGAVLRTVTFRERVRNAVVNDLFADPENNLFALNADGTLLAVSFPSGALRVFDLQDSGKDLTIYEQSEFTRFEGGFFGQYMAFSATGGGQSVFAVIDVPGVTQLGGFASTMPFHVQADESGIYISTEDVLVRLDLATGEQTEVAYTDADITSFVKSGGYALTVTADNAFSIFGPGARLLDTWEDSGRCDFAQMAGSFAVVASADAPALRVLKLENHPEAQMFSYDPAYTHNEARLSADAATVMLFRYDRFRLYGIGGEILAEVEIPDARQVYDQQYRRSGGESRLEVIYNSGLIRSYSAADGSLLSETEGEAPDATLYQEYLTDRLRIEAPLHGTPAAYDRGTGELVAELETDGYLTYVTQAGDYVITEYMTAQGERYGLLLNADCEALAYLPNLCDILEDGTLVFDDMAGNLRQSRIYSLQELTGLAQNPDEKDAS